MTKNKLTTRPPIVTIMGHVDHGKTTLLDKIRSANIASREAGAITQHIGAYQTSYKNKLITFIDTPGHAAFVKMRERGARATDIVVLVISASEGIMPQTKECIEIIKSNNLSPIVVLSKIDLANVFLDKAKGQLVEAGLTPEEYGGQVPVLGVSAKTGEGIDKLLETILLHAEVMELESKPNEPFLGVVIESQMAKTRGPVATVLVKEGTLKKGDLVFTESSAGKAKALLDYKGEQLELALPSTPVEILGFTTVPQVGSLVTAIPPAGLDLAQLATPVPKIHVESPGDIKLNVILKSDAQGTLEALKNSFSEEVRVISSTVGQINDNDIYMAESGQAVIYAFNLKTPPAVKTLAENLGVKLFESNIIYEIIDSIQSQVLKLMEPTIDETILGEGTIIAEFKINKVRISGVKVTKGQISKWDLIHLKRAGEIIKDTKVGNIQQAKNIVEQVKTGSECGITYNPYIDFKVGDVIISYRK